MSSAQTERLPALDGLRGIAVLLIVYFHSMRLIGDHSLINGVLFQFTESFHIGVDLFFVLSGYLITSILLRERRSENYYKAFYWRRLLRIFPLYYLTVLVLAFVVPKDLSLSDSPWYIFFASNIYIVHHGFGHAMVSPLWSVAMEEQFYAVWPFVTRLTKGPLLPALMTLLFLSQPLVRFVLPEYAYTNPLTRLDGLVFGSLIAVNWSRWRSWFEDKRIAYVSLMLSSAYLLARAFTWDMRFYSKYLVFELLDFSLVSICFGTVLCVALARSCRPLNRLLQNRLLCSFGVYSYAIYLFHSMIAWPLAKAGLVPWIVQPYLNVLTSLVWATLIAAITWLIAYYSWKLFESPILRFKDRVSYSKEAKPEIALQSA
jgi:peptidoglycan/LPS O-acetylase OafA/YrhL